MKRTLLFTVVIGSLIIASVYSGAIPGFGDDAFSDLLPSRAPGAPGPLIPAAIVKPIMPTVPSYIPVMSADERNIYTTLDPIITKMASYGEKLSKTPEVIKQMEELRQGNDAAVKRAEGEKAKRMSATGMRGRSSGGSGYRGHHPSSAPWRPAGAGSRGYTPSYGSSNYPYRGYQNPDDYDHDDHHLSSSDNDPKKDSNLGLYSDKNAETKKAEQAAKKKQLDAAIQDAKDAAKEIIDGMQGAKDEDERNNNVAALTGTGAFKTLHNAIANHQKLTTELEPATDVTKTADAAAGTPKPAPPLNEQLGGIYNQLLPHLVTAATVEKADPDAAPLVTSVLSKALGKAKVSAEVDKRVGEMLAEFKKDGVYSAEMTAAQNRAAVAGLGNRAALLGGTPAAAGELFNRLNDADVDDKIGSDPARPRRFAAKPIGSEAHERFKKIAIWQPDTSITLKTPNNICYEYMVETYQKSLKALQAKIRSLGSTASAIGAEIKAIENLPK